MLRLFFLPWSSSWLNFWPLHRIRLKNFVMTKGGPGHKISVCADLYFGCTTYILFLLLNIFKIWYFNDKFCKNPAMCFTFTWNKPKINERFLLSIFSFEVLVIYVALQSPNVIFLNTVMVKTVRYIHLKFILFMICNKLLNMNNILSFRWY